MEASEKPIEARGEDVVQIITNKVASMRAVTRQRWIWRRNKTDANNGDGGASEPGREPRGGDICPFPSGLLDYTMRRIRTVFGDLDFHNPCWMLCRCCPGMVGTLS